MTWPPAAHAEWRVGSSLKELSGTPPDDVQLARATAEARIALREAASAATEAAARANFLAELLDEALTVLADVETAPVRAPTLLSASAHEAGLLSPREREVLALVAAGRTNKAIAEELFVSPNTIKTHVASLLSKLHADSRAQLAAMAITRHLHQRAFDSAQ